MVSRPPCMIHNNLNSFELSRISYFSAEFLLFAFTPTFTTFSNKDNNFV